jgi:WD40 repeat protein
MGHKNRYPGVVPFTEDQKDVFFGRNDDIEKLKNLILVRKQVLLYAKSGIGKSSLLNAGVLPKFSNKYVVLKIRFTSWTPGNKISPVQAVLNILKEEDKQSDHSFGQTILDELIEGSDYKKSLWYYFKQKKLQNDHRTFLLVFDQFEELFTYPHNYVEDFKQQLFEITNADISDEIAKLISTKPEFEDDDRIDDLYSELKIKTVYAIRSDRLSLLNRLSDKISNIQRDFYELEPLDQEQAISAIIGPAIKDDDKFISPAFKYEPEAIEKIINALTNTDTQTIESTQLQIVCHRIEENLITLAGSDGILSAKKGSGSLILTETDIPDFKDIFKEYYHNSIDKLPDNEQQNARVFIEDELIRNSQRISLDEGHCKDKINKAILDILVNSHLLRREKNSLGNDSYELSHDTLVEPILEDKEERVKKEKERELYIAHKQATRQRNLKIRNSFIGIFVILILLGFLLYTINLYHVAQNAEQKAEIEKSKALSSASLTKSFFERDKNPTQSLLNVIDALGYDSTNLDAQLQLIDLYANETFYKDLFKNNAITSFVDLSPDEQLIIVADHSNKPKLIDIGGNQILEFPPKHNGKIEKAIFFANSQKILTGGRDGKVFIWDKFGAPLYSADCGNVVWAVAILRNKIIIAGDNNGFIHLYDITMRPVNSIKAHADSIGFIATNDQSGQFATIARDKIIQVFDTNGTLRNTIELPCEAKAITFLEDRIVAGCVNGSVMIYGNDGLLLYEFLAHTGPVQFLNWDSKSKTLISIGTIDNTIKLWDINLRLIKVLKGHNALIRNAIAFNSGDRILSCAENGMVVIHEVKNPGSDELFLQPNTFHPVACKGNSNEFLLGDPFGNIKLLDENLKGIDSINAHEKGILSLASSEDGSIIVSSSKLNDLKIWDQNFKLIKMLDEFKSPIYCIAINNQEKLILIGELAGEAYLISFSGEIIASKDLKNQSIYDIDFVNNEMVVAACQGHDLAFWNFGNESIGKFTHGFTYASSIETLDEFIFFGGAKQEVYIFDFGKFEVVGEFGKHQSQILSICLSGDNNKIVTTDGDSLAILTLLPDLDKYQEFCVKNPFVQGEDKIRSAKFSGDGSFIITSSQSGYIRKIIVDYKSILDLLKEKGYF